MKIPGLLEELATPALPADWLAPCGVLITWQPIDRGQHEHQPREDHMHPHGVCMCLRGMARRPRLLGLLETTVLDETAVIVIIQGLQRYLDRGVR
jgi:hypothetical protein